jgi:hypothetical protein
MKPSVLGLEVKLPSAVRVDWNWGAPPAPTLKTGKEVVVIALLPPTVYPALIPT